MQQINLPNCVLTGRDWNDTGMAGETNSGFNPYNWVVISWTDDGAIGFSPQWHWYHVCCHWDCGPTAWSTCSPEFQIRILHVPPKYFMIEDLFCVCVSIYIYIYIYTYWMNMKFYSLKSRSRAQAAKLQTTETQCNIPNQQQNCN